MTNYITTEELKREIRNLELNILSKGFYLEVQDERGNTVATIHPDKELFLNTTYALFSYDKRRAVLYDLLNRYDRTPLEKRVEEKKYRLRLELAIWC